MEEGAAAGSWEEGNNTVGTIWQDLVKLAIAQLVKNSPAMQETLVRFLGLGRSPGEGHGNSLQYSCLENPMDRGAWWAIVCGVAKSQTRLRDLIHNSVYVLTRISQFLPPFFSPLISIHLFPTSVTISALQVESSVPFF